MDPNHTTWNEQQKNLRRLLSNPNNSEQAIDLFLKQHAMVHSATLSQAELWSFADEVLLGLSEESIRGIPGNGEHSIAWIFWHISRIEDITMNIILSGKSQLLDQDGWFTRLGVPFCETGNAMNKTQIEAVGKGIHIDELLAYRVAVGIRTREAVSQLQGSDLKTRVDPSRLKRVYDEGAVVMEARGLLEYWGSLTYAGLLLMPPTRHNFLHLNEAARIKRLLRGKSSKREKTHAGT